VREADDEPARMGVGRIGLALPGVRREAAEVNSEEWAAAKERNIAAREARAPVQPRKQAKREAPFTITWLDPPVKVGRFTVCGVCSDTDPDVARLYGVRL
jgi:hypothetical protein